MSRKIKLLYVIPLLDDGGAQRFSIHFLRNLNRTEFDVTLLLLQQGGELSHLLPPNLKIVTCNKTRTALAFWPIIKNVWRLHPDVLFTTLGHLNLIVSIAQFFFPSSTKTIARETNYISLRNKDEKYPKLFDFLFRTVYKKLDAIICQSESMKQDLEENYGIPPKKLHVIYNPVDHNYIEKLIRGASPFTKSRIDFLSVGRLTAQKGYDRILEALSNVNFKDFSFRILGQGPEEVNLKKLVIELDLERNVEFVGYSDNPFLFMVNSDCLLLGSRYEGFSNVVLEAHACGLPVIAFDSPGVAESIDQELNGRLVRNHDINAFTEVINSQFYLKADRIKIKEHNHGKYAVNKVLMQYESFIKLIALKK